MECSGFHSNVKWGLGGDLAVVERR